MAATEARGTGFVSRVEGLVNKTMQKESNTASGFNNPFGTTEAEDQQQRRPSDDENAMEKQRSNDSSLADVAGSPPEGLSPDRKSRDRSMSKEWDASKVPPSRFQKRKGSIYATASSRDSHLDRKDRDSSYFAKLKEKGWH